MEKEAHQNIKGDANPMRRQEVAAKQAASLKKTWSDPEKRKQILKSRKPWTPEMRAAFSDKVKQQYADGRAPAGKQWSDERKQAHSERLRVYWDKVRAGLAMLENQHHEN